MAGDAASLVSPLTSEGIKQAVISGEIAAQCALRALETGKFTQSELALYGASLRQMFGKRFRQLALLNAIIQIPGFMNRLVKSLSSDAAVQSLLQRTIAQPDTWNALRLAELLVRIAA